MQAVLITAYNDYSQLKRLVVRLLPFFLVLVHVDKSSDEICSEQIAELNDLGALAFSKYHTYWGSFNHLQAIMEMAKIAISEDDITHIHVLSGQDYPVKPVKDIAAFFEDNNQVYMTVLEQSDFDNHMQNNVYYYDFFQQLNTKKTVAKCVLYSSWLFQRAIGVKREAWGEFGELYQGLIWLSAPRDVWSYFLGYVDTHPSFVRDMKRIRLPEEYVFQTVIMNSEYRSRVVNNNLRYDLWEEKNGSKPAILDEGDWTAIQESGALFARKINSTISASLIYCIDKQFHDSWACANSSSSASRARVDILLATFNGEKYLADQVSSIVHQTHQHWRLLISDDGSADATRGIIRELQLANSRISDVTPQFSYGSAKDNFFYLLGQSESEYVMFCDQDDVWDSDKIEKSIVAMKNAEAISGSSTPTLVFSDLRVVDKDLKVLANSFFRYSHINPKKCSFANLLSANVVPGCTILMNRALIDLALENGLPDDAYMHDWWVMLVASSAGVVVLQESATMSYRQHDSNSLGAKEGGVSALFQAGVGLSCRGILDKVKSKITDERNRVNQAAAFLDTYGSMLSRERFVQATRYSAIFECSCIERIAIAKETGALSQGGHPLLRLAAIILAEHRS